MIRHAKFTDYYEIIQMLQAFALESPCEYHHMPITNIRRIQNLLSTIQKSGVVLVSETENRLQGMILGQITPDLLFPEVRILRELVWWVAPEARLGTTGARLLKKYTEFGLDLQTRGIIQGINMTTLVSTPDLKLTTRGWNQVETHYLFGGK